MSNDRPKRDMMSIEEATLSNMWEIAAIVEVLERKGLCTKPKSSSNVGDATTIHTARIVHWGISQEAPETRVLTPISLSA